MLPTLGLRFFSFLFHFHHRIDFTLGVRHQPCVPDNEETQQREPRCWREMDSKSFRGFQRRVHDQRYLIAETVQATKYKHKLPSKGRKSWTVQATEVIHVILPWRWGQCCEEWFTASCLGSNPCSCYSPCCLSFLTESRDGPGIYLTGLFWRLNELVVLPSSTWHMSEAWWQLLREIMSRALIFEHSHVFRI